MAGILIFESDMEFAQGLQSELARRGCSVSVVADANEGLEQAALRRPDLILLCTELPRMNGFSVCNRLKRDPALETVPVIIMSANASEETFQQHRNLTKKRAQDYVHKPISVGEMVGRVEKFVNFNGQAAPAEVSLEELDVEDMEELDEAAASATDNLSPSEFDHPVPSRSNPPSSVAPTSGGSWNAPERGVNELTEEAFGAMMKDPPPLSKPASAYPPRSSPPVANLSRAPRTSAPPGSSPSASGSGASLAPRGSAAPASNSSAPGSMPGSSLPGPAGSSLAPHAGQSQEPAEPEGTMQFGSEPPPSGRRSSRSARRRSGAPDVDAIPGASRVPLIAEAELDGDVNEEHVLELERTLSETRARLEAVYQELDVAKSKESGGAARAHEILDLREALNRKDKELLELRDELTRRDKELLAANDRALEFERKNAEVREQSVELEKRMHSADRAQQAALQDREQANKRADGYKRKAEKGVEELEQQRVLHVQLHEEQRQLLDRVERAESNLAEVTARLERSEQSLTEVTTRHAEAQRRADDLQADLNDAEKDLAALEEQSDALQTRQAEADRRLKATEQQLDDSQLQLTDARERLEQHKNAESHVRELIGQAARKLGELG